MKALIPALFLIFAANTVCLAQYGVNDTHPTATISIIDPQSGQEMLTRSDTAILFKDAVIDLVNNTIVVQTNFRHVVGHLGYVITQTDPSNGNEYQVQQTTRIFGTTSPVYTFIYNVDQNKLFYVNNQDGNQTMVPQWISQNNLGNLDRCQQFGWFNNLNSGPQNNVQAAPAVENYQPVDNEVTTAAAPPALPQYQQPECPQDGYLWQPGYWAYSTQYGDYYWVPGVWVAPPSPDLLWTPAYWAFDGLRFIYHGGYWSGNVGYYGGIDYGYGYAGHGYFGGEWRDGRFRYNTAVVRVGNSVHNTYINKTVIVVEPARNNSSFNGRGGVVAHPLANEVQVMHQPHVNPTTDQLKNQWIARGDKNQFAKNNDAQKPMNLAHDKVPVQATTVNTSPHGNAMPAAGNAGQTGGWHGRPVGATPVNQRPANNAPTGSASQVPAAANNNQPATNNAPGNKYQQTHVRNNNAPAANAPATNIAPANTNQPATNTSPANTYQQTHVRNNSNNAPAANGATVQPSGFSGHSNAIPAGSGANTQQNNSRGGMQNQNNNGGTSAQPNNQRQAAPAVVRPQPSAPAKVARPASTDKGKKSDR